MALSQEKINIMRRRRSDKSENKSIWPDYFAWDFLSKFAIKEKPLLLKSLAFLFSQGLLEVALIIVSHRYLRNFSGAYGFINSYSLFILLVLLSCFYLFSAYFAIKQERTLVIRLINDLRARWFKIFLFKREEENSLEKKSWLIAKISYHLPLLSTGLNNSLTSLIRWFLFIVILIILAFVFSVKLFIFIALALIVSVIIFFLGYFVSKNYVSRETTFYSHIIRWVDFNLSDWKFLKKFKQEKMALSEFNDLVELDSYFRVKRDLWLRFSTSLIFVLLIFFGFISGFWSSRLEYFFGSASLDAKFILIVVLMYFSRLLYEGVRAGLYSAPFLLGLKLSVPEKSARLSHLNKRVKFKTINFKAERTKLFKKAQRRKFEFSFAVGLRYLITADHRSGKSFLAKLFTGNGSYGRRAWVIKKDKTRYLYNQFFHQYSNFYYLDPEFSSSRSLLEVVCGKDKRLITEEDLVNASNLVNKHKELSALFFEKEDWRYLTNKFCLNAKNRLVIQVLHCLFSRPALIAIDNFWLDKSDEEVNKLLKILALELKDSAIIFFSTLDNELIDYDQKYNF